MANEKSLKESLLAASPFLIKVVEIILGLTSICLIISPYSSRLHTSTGRAGFVYSALSGAVLVDLLIVVSHFLQQKIPKKPVSPNILTTHHIGYQKDNELSIRKWDNIDVI
ncbi:PREDICTED: uncharacterized protein LOC107167471 [Diuraphis noxia]|uniref:uncharacterized protein LOC107167471 n=1 Tax=Diuraphis noxia TaxID=143948 RepID=UPI000763AD90|nr:PREDICTED: uncharacterized protein LOC107167471 [Diuraphis noxia]